MIALSGAGQSCNYGCARGLFRGFLAMVMRLFAPQFLVVWAFLGSAIAVHFRGKVRLGFWRQFTDHSTIMAPYNVLMYLFSAVPNRPILQVGMVPELDGAARQLADHARRGVDAVRAGPDQGRRQVQRLGFQFVLPHRVEAVLSEMVRGAAAVGARQLPEDRRDC